MATTKEVRAAILAGLDIAAEYRALGLTLKSDTPRASGKIEAYAAFREDSKASAWIDVNSGLYGDSGSQEKAMSIFDFAIQKGTFPDFKSCYSHYAKVAGVEFKASQSKKKNSPDDLLQFENWSEGNDTLINLWCMKCKPGITLESVKEAGGKPAYWPCWKNDDGVKQRGRNKVIALPCYGEHKLDQPPQAWVIWSINGRLLEIYQGKDRAPNRVKMVSVGDTAGTLMGSQAINDLCGDDTDGIETVWKTAGPTDMMALMSAIPGARRKSQLVICNASGETGDIASWNVGLLAGQRVNVVGDADKAGEFGATKWINALTVAASELKHVRLPYEISDKSGLDLRHFLTEDKQDFFALEALAEKSKISAVPPSLPENSKPEDDMSGIERQTVGLVKLDVLGQVEGGGVKVFSTYHRKSEVIPRVGKMDYDDLLRIAGPPVKERVAASRRDLRPGMVTIDEVKQAISLLGGYKVISDQTELGAGCWAGMDTDGMPHPSVVVVGSGEASEWNGSRKLEKITHPRCRGHLLDFESGTDPWYDEPSLRRMVEGCTQEFALAAVNDAITLFESFSWKHKSSAVTTTGLALATWVQSLWDWRPQVAIVGPTDSGKTTLFNVLARLFGPLTIMSSGSTAAGIRQAIKASAKIILCDEFESSRHRNEILEMLRMSGRGGKILRGTTNQKGQGFGLQHIAWVAAIEVGLKRAPDRNRFIMLELAIPPKRRERLVLPSPASLADLGQRLLASSIRYIQAAQPLATALKDQRVEGVGERIIESYAVPAAILAAIHGFDETGAVQLLREMLVDMAPEDDIADESDLIHKILAGMVHTGRETMAVSQLLAIVLEKGTESPSAEQHLAKHGLKLDYFAANHPYCIPGNDDSKSSRCLLIAHDTVTGSLLRGTPWEHQSIEQILKRIPGAEYGRRRVGGHRCGCVAIPEQLLLEEYLGYRDGQLSAF